MRARVQCVQGVQARWKGREDSRGGSGGEEKGMNSRCSVYVCAYSGCEDEKVDV